jgi:uncharacterized protein YfaS (alpha-2-macroglobulin family)
MRGTLRSLVLIVAGLLPAACATHPQNAQETPARLAPVAALPKPSLPPWIAQISPTASAQSLAQIRVVFAKPVTKVEALEGAGPADILGHLRVDPALPGHFVVYTPRLIGFVADAALPIGTRVRVTLMKGLRDLDGDTLAHDLAWTFTTQPVELSDLPQAVVSPGESTPAPVSLRPTISISSNAEIDVATLAQHASLRAGGQAIALDVALKPTLSPPPDLPADATAAFDESNSTWTYLLSPRTALDRSTTYTLTIAPGVMPVRGNLPTARAFGGSVRTYDALAVTPTASPDAATLASGQYRFANGDPVVTLNNPIDAKTLDGNVSISPQPSPAPKLSVDDSTISIDPYALDPNANYTLTIGTGLKDVFGLSLAQSAQVPIHTGNFAPGAWAPQGTTLLPADAGIDINFYATNVPGNAYRAAFAPLKALQLLQPSGAADALPSPAAAWPQFPLPNARTNAQSVVRINVQQRIGAPFGALDYGFWTTALGGQDAAPLTGIVQITNLGIFAQFFPGRASIMTQHLSDGSPAQTTIDVYRIPDTGTPQVCSSGRAGSDGIYSFSGVDIQRCYATAPSDGIPTLGIIAREGGDTATLTVYDYSGAYRFDVPYGWAGGAPRSVGTIFPDRDLYQPGERGVFTGIAYYVQDGTTHADTNATYSVSLIDPSGNAHPAGSATTDRYGTFSFSYTFPKTQGLGYYGISAKGARGFTVEGGFRVAEFKPPNFKLDVSASADSAAAGSSVTATATGAYLFGAPLDGGKARIFVTRQLAQLAPKGWDDFTFGRRWFWPEQPPEVPSDVLQRDTTLDTSGHATQSVSVPSDLPAPLTYTVEFDASDVSQLSVSNSASFLALPADGLIGTSSDIVVPANQAMPVKVIVTDASGKAIDAKPVHLELQRMTYVSAAQAEEGGESAQQSIRYDTVAQADVTSGAHPVTANLTPDAAGPFRIHATFPGQGDASATDSLVFAFGANAADFGAHDTNSVTVTLDKKKYHIGDTATAVVGSPYDHADVYLSVVRHDTICSTLLHNVHGAPHVSFKITQAMFPNAAVQAVVVRRGAPLGQIKAGSLDSLSRTGMTAFNIDLRDRYLHLAIAPQHAKLSPGGTQSVTFTLGDSTGRPARGKVIAAVVNDAVLQLSGYRLPDLVTTIFADQPISTRFADNRENVTLQTPQAPLEKGYGYGGGFLEGAAGTRVRTNFLPLAYYGSAVADASGHATLRFTLPDDLTTWRVMAVAVGDDDTHFGTNDATFISALPLMANPLLPQFARPGDVVDGGASVLANGSSDLKMLMDLSGALRFQNGSDPNSMEIFARAQPQMTAYRYPMAAQSPGPGKLTVHATQGSARDAFSVSMPVLDRSSTESVIDTGVTSSRSAIPVAFDRPGTVNVDIANSVVPQLDALAKRALDDDESFGLSDEYASRLIIAALAGVDAGNDLNKLAALQRDDGGFGLCRNAKTSDPFATAYALEALAFRSARGARVDDGVRSRAHAFESQTLADPARFSWCTSALCRAQLSFSALLAMAADGDRRSDHLDQIVAQSAAFDTATQLRLARYLIALPAWRGQGEALADRLLQAVHLSGRYAVANVAEPWGWRGDAVAAQAQTLQLLMERHAPGDQIDGAARALLSQQCRCGWPTLAGTASALMALDAYSAMAPPRAMAVTVSDGTHVLARASLGAAAAAKSFSFAASDVHGKAVTIETNAGSAHYIMLYTYTVPSDAPGALAAFRVTRTVRDPGAPAALALMDLAPLGATVQLDSGRVFDVGIRVVVDHPVDRLVIEDPLPAGFEAIDTSFATASQAQIALTDSWEIGDKEIYRDRVTAFVPNIGPGIYEMHYLVRSVTPGTYRWPGARAYLTDAPEQFGRSAAATLQLR